MIRNTVTEAAETLAETPETPETVAPADLIPLAELAAEGFGWGGQFVKTPKDAIDALARQLDGAIYTDDLGRRCTDRDTARRLLAERAERERRQREQAERQRAELAKRRRPTPRGVPAVEGMSAWETMLAASGEDEARKDAAGRRMAAYMSGVDSGESFVIRHGDAS